MDEQPVKTANSNINAMSLRIAGNKKKAPSGVGETLEKQPDRSRIFSIYVGPVVGSCLIAAY